MFLFAELVRNLSINKLRPNKNGHIMHWNFIYFIITIYHDLISSEDISLFTDQAWIHFVAIDYKLCLEYKTKWFHLRFIKHIQCENDDIYLIWSKAYWTFQNNVDDLNWISSSIEILDTIFEQYHNDWIREKMPELVVKMKRSDITEIIILDLNHVSILNETWMIDIIQDSALNIDKRNCYFFMWLIDSSLDFHFLFNI